METLELKSLGLQELDSTELKESNGGWWQIIAAAILIDALLNPDDAIDAMVDGYNAARSLSKTKSICE